jgi:hypothetical protein
VADLTLAQLLVPRTKDQIRERIFGRLNRADFPATDFEEGAVVRTTVEACAEGIADFVAGLIPRIAGGGFTQEADVEWLRMLAKQNYDLEQLPATFTTQRLTLTAAVGVGPYPVVAGDLVARAASGNRYILAEAGTIPSGGSVQLLFQAESPGSQYTDAAGLINELITALPEVTVVNAAPTFTAVAHAGSGTGTVSLSGTPTGPSRFTLTIATDGQANAATFEFSQDGGLPQVGGVCSSSGVTLPGGTVVTFTNGANIPSFVAGDSYTFTTPGTPVVTQGKDQETREDLAARMIARWPSLAEIPTTDKYEQWARAAAGDVTKVTVRPANSAATPGRVEIVIAGAVNPLSAAVPLVQAYVNERAPITDHPAVSAATVVEVFAAGQVWVKAKDLAAIQAGSQLAWQLYLASLPIGGTYRMAELAQLLMDLGAVDFRSLLVGPTGDITHLDVTVGPAEVAQVPAASTLTTQLTWIII